MAGLFLALLLGGARVTAKAQIGRRSYVITSVAKLRKEPDKGAEVIATLRIGTETEVLKKQGPWFKVRTATQKGWLNKKVLRQAPPTLASLQKRAEAAKGKQARRVWLERATAFAPGDLETIAALRDSYRSLGRKKSAWIVEKGLIAAERRHLSWDGPLYPIVEQVALLPRACWEEPLPKKKPSRKVLRGRAFPLVASGKVVSVSETGYRTQRLSEPLCVPSACAGDAGAGASQAGFRLPFPARSGALVPSWLVAGHRVVAYRGPTGEGEDRVFVDEKDQTRVRVAPEGYVFSVHTLDGWRDLDPRPLLREGAEPVAQLSEHERHRLILWKAPGARGCCEGDTEVWLDRFEQLGPGEEVVFEHGRVYSSGFAGGCAQERFSDLEGEPRCERLPEGCELGPPGLVLP